MLSPLTCAHVRQVDRDAVTDLGLPSLLLMENAAYGVFNAIQRDGPWTTITILAGPGNNGGDGLAVARLLAAHGVDAVVFLVRAGKQLSGDAASNLAFLKNSGVVVTEASPEEIQKRIESLSSFDLIVDALLGTGIRGMVATPFIEIIQFINKSSARILAVDVPSGLDCDRGIPCGHCVSAHTTVTFVAQKKGFLADTAMQFLGRVEVCPIGIPQGWLEKWQARMNAVL